MQNSGVVLAAELATNFGERGLGEVLREVHGDLPGIDDGTGVVLRLDLGNAQSELLSASLLDGLDGDLTGLLVDDVLQHLLRGHEIQFATGQGRVGDETNESAFEFADVAANVRSDE